MSKNIEITLTKEEWSNVNTWVTSASRQTHERVSQNWFTELLDIVKPFYMSLYFSDDSSSMKIPYDSKHALEIERKYFKYLVYSVGRIAYDFDCKTITSNIALGIVKKLEDQGDENWKKNRW